ncbi:heavy metal-associated isoprenylated plant protein 39 [Capsicum galapagoense]
MKQKVVIRLSLSGNDQKYRTKAFKIAVSQSGVESAAIKGDDKNQLEVVGEIDAAALTSLLRKNLGQADLVSVGPAGGGGDKEPKAGSDKKPEVAAAVVQSQPALYYYAYPSYQYPVYQVNDPYDQPNCSIM